MNIKQIPNYLTILRIILWIPLTLLFYIAYQFQLDEKKFKIFLYSAFIIFVLAMLSDFLDGYLARKYKAISTFGKLFDPLSDKIIISTTLIFLALLQITEIWIVVIFIVRDILVDGFRNLAAKNNKKVEASIWGKLKTVTQTFAIFVLILVYPLIVNYKETFYWILNIPMFLALFFSIFSGIFYFKEIFHFISFKNNL
ncbi:CDP-diacylglycerol--glycerol-3-phosphate 3-phosphatidyltransferase [[Mycoplasma] collis]|uniref:CDP-diacylglycerol--glycerol-3-phosphate 3-phosphatidyltransferase n=1 Tax=[Mycoplasma] collis TaxID=2127 RepID=UPI00051C82B5|nr:CDP-diacylglycerol--glycerol-3-phosphate 3-phosphatidyltransferase [[Mycoplasma] collis]